MGKPKDKFRSSNTGFTLIEAIVSVSVFAVAMSGIAGVYLSAQHLNQTSSAMQAMQQNGRFIIDDITRLVRNGTIDYARYGGAGVPQNPTDNLYLIDKDGTEIGITKSGSNLVIEKVGYGRSNYNGKEVRVARFRIFIWPAFNPFPGGQQQPTVTVYLDLEADTHPGDVNRLPLQVTVATRQYD